MKTATEIIEYIPGSGCECSAYSSYECGCDVDWTSREELELKWKVEFLKHKLLIHNLLTQEIKDVVDNPFEIISKNNKHVPNPSLDQYKNVTF